MYGKKTKFVGEVKGPNTKRPPIEIEIPKKVNELVFEEETVLKILALGLPNETPDHRVRYLLKKLYGKDCLNLDYENDTFLERIKKISEDL